MYDAFMSLALSTCDSARSQGSTFTTSTFHDSFVNQDFVRATGTARFNNDTGSRLSDTSEFVVSNIPADGDLNEEGLVTFRKSDTHVYAINGDGTVETTWNPLPYITFIYSDNRTVALMNLLLLVQPFDEIETWSTVIRCVACVFVTAVAVGFWVWMQLNLKLGPILAAQPSFMRMIAGGVALMAVSPRGSSLGIAS